MRPLKSVVAVTLALAACTAPSDRADAGLDAGPPDAAVSDGGSNDGGWVALFNGSDLSGWHKYLGAPSDGGAVLGLDNDPRGVFGVVMTDGEPAIHITGEVWGSLISIDDYDDFELELQFKWGTLTWPPLHSIDSGIMYLSHGDYGAVNAGGMGLSNPIGSGAFMVSMEYQLVPGDVGGVYNLGPIGFTASPRVHVPEPTGWANARIVMKGGTATHYLEGTAVSGGSNFINTWPGQQQAPVTRGRLQLQCEGAEIYFRHVRLRRL